MNEYTHQKTIQMFLHFVVSDLQDFQCGNDTSGRLLHNGNFVFDHRIYFPESDRVIAIDHSLLHETFEAVLVFSLNESDLSKEIIFYLTGLIERKRAEGKSITLPKSVVLQQLPKYQTGLIVEYANFVVELIHFHPFAHGHTKFTILFRWLLEVHGVHQVEGSDFLEM